MSRNLIASKLIESVRQRAMIPDDTSVYDDQAILDILNEEIDVGLLDTLLTLNEEHLVTFTDAVRQSGNNRLIIPSRAVGSKLRDLHIVTGSNSCEMSRVDLGEISDYESGGYSNAHGNNLFYVEGDEIILLSPNVGDGGRFRMYFHLRPNVVTLEDTSAQISSIDRETGIIEFVSIPKTFTTLSSLDFIQNNSPNKILSFDIPVVSVTISTRNIVIDPISIPNRLQVGDWVCVPETSPYANVPTELHPVLAQRAACFILEAMGDLDNLGASNAKLKKMEKAVQKLLDNRVQGANRKIKSRHGFLQNKMSSRNRASRGNF